MGTEGQVGPLQTEWIETQAEVARMSSGLTKKAANCYAEVALATFQRATTDGKARISKDSIAMSQLESNLKEAALKIGMKKVNASDFSRTGSDCWRKLETSNVKSGVCVLG